jgi:hypothetical protein
VEVDDEHPLIIIDGELRVLIKDELYAQLNRNSYYELIDLALSQGSVENDTLILNSKGTPYLIGTLTE